MRSLIATLLIGLTAPAIASADDIVDVAAGNPNFSTLVAAVKAAGLVDTLKSEGPFTVFAPTNDAFAKLPEGTIDTLLKPENKDQLVKILTYHVVPGRVPASQVVTLNGQDVKTVEGSTARVQVSGGKVMVGDANVIQTDVEASNGIIHVIDSVLLPPAAAPATPTAMAPAPHTAAPRVVYIYTAAPVYHPAPQATYYTARPAAMPVYRRSCGR